MQLFESLTQAGQVRRIGRLARLALEEYGLEGARLSPIHHWENTTFRVDVKADRASNASFLPNNPYIANRYLLRVHSVGYQTPASIASELAWLQSLRAQTDLAVPQPLFTTGGASVAVAEAEGVPQARACSLLRWVSGRFSRGERPAHYEALGEAMARLHNHASRWTPPADFTRRRWDWDGFFGQGAALGAGIDAWNLLPREHRPLFEKVAERARSVMDGLGYKSDAWGLLHADLHWNNVLLAGRESRLEVRLIDFDDCGWGHWAYDFAVVLGRQFADESPEHIAQRQALMQGYARHRAVPHEQLQHIKIYIAARRVALALWAAQRALDNPAFREHLPSRLDRTTRDCNNLLGLS